MQAGGRGMNRMVGWLHSWIWIAGGAGLELAIWTRELRGTSARVVLSGAFRVCVCVCVYATGPVQDHANALVLFRRASSVNQILAPCSPHLFIEFQNSSYIVPRSIHLELILRIIIVSFCCTTPSQATPFTLKFTL